LIYSAISDKYNARPMLVRLMQIVFEIASCPWRDDCKPSSIQQFPPLSYRRSTTSSHHFHHDEDCDLMLRCMLLRKDYGGMKCDVKMIDKYVQLWGRRYNYTPQAMEVDGSEGTSNINALTTSMVDPKLIAACLPKLYEQNIRDKEQQLIATRYGIQIQWKEIPRIIHASPKESGIKLIPQLIRSKICYLQKHDITPAGVDFHCSNVLDATLSNPSFSCKVEQILGCSLDKDELAGILKAACWKCSAGVNHRRVFDVVSSDAGMNSSVDDEKNVPDDCEKSIWKEALPIVNQFTEAYIESRLVK